MSEEELSEAFRRLLVLRGFCHAASGAQTKFAAPRWWAMLNSINGHQHVAGGLAQRVQLCASPNMTRGQPRGGKKARVMLS